MGMMRFGLVFPEVAERETRTVRVLEVSPATWNLPVDEYGFDELYCTERGCDCRRVMINVLARHMGRHVATINHAFEKPPKDAAVVEQTFLDPLNRQSPWGAALLELFRKVVLADAQYRQRVERHYRMFKNVVEDPAHPCQAILRGSASGQDITMPAAAKATPRAIPPPPRRGKRRRWGR